MYDTLHLWLPAEKINESGYLDRVPTLLDDTKESYKCATGELYYSGKIMGMNASVSGCGLSLKGSICKSFLGENFSSLTRQDTQRAIEQLEDCLGLPILECKVSRLDFGNSIEVEQKPEFYYPYLGECRHYNRLEQSKSLYYRNGKIQKVFYNKVAEAKANRQPIPSKWLDRHNLRYESRYTSRLPKEFDKVQVHAKDLYNETFYLDMANRWVNEFKNINKNNLILDRMNTDLITSPKDYFYQMALLKIKEVGINEVFESVELMKGQNLFKHKEYYSRLKKDIRKLCNSDLHTERSPLINELDRKIMEVKESCR